MGFNKDPVRGVPDPYDRYRAEPIGERQTKRDSFGPKKDPPEDKEGLIAHLVNILEKGVNAVLEKISHLTSGGPSKKTALHTLKALFEVLKNEDRSQDIDYLKELSSTWNRVMEESLEFRENAEIIFQELIKKILYYPEGQTHTFGYYLTEYAGQKWIPFPYMDLIKNLHSEHEKNPSFSSLTEWTRLINDTLSLLNEK